MKNLKKKFGKFAISQKQTKQIIGGSECKVVFWCHGKVYPTETECNASCNDFCHGQYVFPC